MAVIEGFDAAKRILGEFRFREFQIIRELHYYQVEERHDRCSYNVDLVIESLNRRPNYQMKLKFGDVSGFHHDAFGGGLTQIVGFDIQDVSAQQWDRVKWEVTDFEDDRLELRARTAEIVCVTAVE